MQFPVFEHVAFIVGAVVLVVSLIGASWHYARISSVRVLHLAIVLPAAVFAMTLTLWVVQVYAPAYIATNYMANAKALATLVIVTCVVVVMVLLRRRPVGWHTVVSALITIVMVLTWRLLPAYPTERVLRVLFTERQPVFDQLAHMVVSDLDLYGAEALNRVLYAPSVDIPASRFSPPAASDLLTQSVLEQHVQDYWRLAHDISPLSHLLVTDHALVVSLPSTHFGDNSQVSFAYAVRPDPATNAPQFSLGDANLHFVPLQYRWFMFSYFTQYSAGL